MSLKVDPSAPAGEPKMLFKASDNPDVSELQIGRGTYVTEVPFLWNEFATLEGKRMIALHTPDTVNLERAFFTEF